MDFDLSDDQQQLREAVRRWVDKAYGFERHRAIAAAGGFSAEAWGELAGLGLTALAVPEAHGGLGWGAVEAMLVMEELGRGLLLEPYAPAALMVPALLAAAPAELQSRWLPAIAAGDALVVPAHQERGARHRLAHVETRAAPVGTQWLLDGGKSLVPAGDQADALLVSARVHGAVDAPDGLALFLVERRAGGLQCRGHGLQDGARAAELQLHDTPATLLAGPGAAWAALERAVDVGLAALCAEAVGVMAALLALTADHLNTRHQFGVPIARFQALRHRIADARMQLELARSMSWLATLRLADEPAVRRRAVSMAKLQIGRSARFVDQQCVQLHGAIGVTDDCIASHHFKRLTCIELTLGDTLHHLGDLSTGLQDSAGVFA